MAGVPSSELKTFAGFPGGIDNLSHENSVSSSRLRIALNVDIDNKGKLSRRDGFGLIEAMPGLHSLFSDERFPYMLFADATKLYAADTSLTITEIATLQRNATLSYVFDGRELRYSNGSDCGIVTLDGQYKPWSVSMPAGQPTLGVNALAGGLSAGDYQVAITFKDAYGRESGSHAAAFTEVPENGGLLLSDWPEQPADVVDVCIYMTSANGDLLYLAETLAAPVSGTLLLGRRTLGRALDTMFLTPMPAGRFLCLWNGLLFCEVNGVLIWSEALNYGLTKRHENWVRYREINMIAAGGQNGLFIAAEKRTFFQQGASPASWARSIVSSCSAVPHSMSYMRASDLELEVEGLVPVWLDNKGELVAGMPDGTLARLHKDYYIGPENAEQGASLIRQVDGIRQLMVVSKGGTVAAARASDSVDIEVCRNGVIIP